MISVYTVGDFCKKCYSCVRACPTKAIKVHEGQASIIEEYCVSCGLCVTVCSQNAKKIRSSTEKVISLLEDRDKKTYAMLAPSFPASFLDIGPDRLVGALRALGFDGVYEVAFGADIVSHEYHKRYSQLLENRDSGFIISTPCPAVVFYVEKIYPELVPHLANIASPMEAMARVIKKKSIPMGRSCLSDPAPQKRKRRIVLRR